MLLKALRLQMGTEIGNFRRTILDSRVLFRSWFEQLKEVIIWRVRGQPTPPPRRVKQRVVKEYGKRFGLQTLVETGTYRGEMVTAVKSTFADIYSIELNPQLFQAAHQQFSRDPHIHLLQGDSAEVLPELLPHLSGPLLFWLDAHYSGGITSKATSNTPVMEEIRHILAQWKEGSVILIDDARLFTDQREYLDYPTLDEIRAFVQAKFPGLVVTVDNDIIPIHTS